MMRGSIVGEEVSVLFRAHEKDHRQVAEPIGEVDSLSEALADISESSAVKAMRSHHIREHDLAGAQCLSGLFDQVTISGD